jgi:hypothetical protein
MDLLWIVDASTSSTSPPTTEYETPVAGKFDLSIDAVEAYTGSVTMASQGIRQGILAFAGEYYNQLNGDYIGFQTAVASSLFTDGAATSNAAFVSFIQAITTPGGTTNTSGAIHIARETFFTEANKRSDAQRVVVLITDSAPSDRFGTLQESTPDVTEAINMLKQEDSVLFVFLRMAGQAEYPTNWLVDESDLILDTADFASLSTTVVADSFLCFDSYTPSPTSV